MNKTKMKWLFKLAATRNFVVLTDKQYIINVRGISPDSMSDILAVANQQATLESLRDQLDALIKDYEKNVTRALGVPSEPPKKAKKIKVKEG